MTEKPLFIAAPPERFRTQLVSRTLLETQCVAHKYQ